MNVVGVAGYRNSGKTTLVERLVPRLATDGTVATVKGIHHDIEIDTEGKDTYRHRVAGADAVVGVTPSLTVSIVPSDAVDDTDPDDRLARGLAQLAGADYDVVLAEGFKEAHVPTIVVGDIPTDDVQGTVIARVDDPKTADVDAIVAAIRDTLPTTE